MATSGLPIRTSNTLAEIFSQPQIWRRILADLPANSTYRSFLTSATSCRESFFVGCGTSFYLAEAAAAAWTLVTGQRARAVPASEVLLFPGLFQLESANLQAVIISRSGRTSEAVRAAEFFARRQIPTLALTCSPDSELSKICEFVLAVSSADEQSVVMTRSFSSMLLVVIHLAVSQAGAQHSSEFDRIASSLAAQISSYSDRVETFTASHSFADYIYVGQGPFYSLAREGCLKVTEMSCSYAQAYHTLEFRHGPKSVVGPQTCLTFFLSESGMEAESEVLAEMKGLGGTIIGICNRAAAPVRRSCDLLFEFDAGVPEVMLLPPSIVPAQLLAFHTAVKKGFNPDKPKNLSRVVILD